jgi:hypothetical protein
MGRVNNSPGFRKYLWNVFRDFLSRSYGKTGLAGVICVSGSGEMIRVFVGNPLPTNRRAQLHRRKRIADLQILPLKVTHCELFETMAA